MTLLKRRDVAVAEKPRVSHKSAKVSVTHPGKKEKIRHPRYTMQVEVGEPAASVEVLINGGDWQPCREALGRWWFDWSGYDANEHKVVARLLRPDGTSELSEPRIFEVDLD